MRRLVGDLLWAASAMPTVPVQRRMRLAELVAARALSPIRPSWTAIFTKAYARVAAVTPELRRAYVKLPWPHLYEYDASAAAITIEREHEGENVVFLARINQPDRMPLSALSHALRELHDVPVESRKEFRRALRFSRVPWPLRRWLWWLSLNMARPRGKYFGTFAVTVYSGLGAESLHPLYPVTTTLNYGVIGADGAVDVRITYDHRVMDGATVARALEKLQTELTGEIVAELRSMPDTRQDAA
jgi:hypothetical protein